MFCPIPTTKIGVLFALFVCTAPVKQAHATHLCTHKDLGTLCHLIDDIQSTMHSVPRFLHDIKYTASAVNTLLTLCDTYWNKYHDTCIAPVKAVLEQLISHNRIDDAKQCQQYIKQYTQPMEQSKQAITHSLDQCAQALKPLLTYLMYMDPVPRNRGIVPSVAPMLLQQWYTQCKNLCTTCEEFKANNPVQIKNHINAMRHYLMGRERLTDIPHVDNPPQHRTSAPLPSDVDP